MQHKKVFELLFTDFSENLKHTYRNSLNVYCTYNIPVFLCLEPRSGHVPCQGGHYRPRVDHQIHRLRGGRPRGVGYLQNFLQRKRVIHSLEAS